MVSRMEEGEALKAENEMIKARCEQIKQRLALSAKKVKKQEEYIAYLENKQKNGRQDKR